MPKIFDYELHNSPDVWDRIYAIDQFIIVNGHLICFQIKPASFNSPTAYGSKRFIKNGNEDFYKKYGFKVFTLIKEKGEVKNKQVLPDIKKEIDRLLKLPKGIINTKEDINTLD